MSAIPLKTVLDEAGLNRQHVFDVSSIPAGVLAPLSIASHEKQLFLFGHAGRRLWSQVQAGGSLSAHPIDDYSVSTVEQWFTQALPDARYRFVYPRGLPTGQHVGLQRLGALAGWHHPTPFMVGIDSSWGSWFAYRAAVLADTDLPASPPVDQGHPCEACVAKPCITACPAGALDSGALEMDKCREQRLLEGSTCALACLARQACPIGIEHRYEDSQIRHSYAGSLRVLRRISRGS